MSQAVYASNLSSPSGEVGEASPHAAAATEIAIRAVVGVIGVQALSGAVRRHPWLSLFFATGVGYLLGNGWVPGVKEADGESPSQDRRAA